MKNDSYIRYEIESEENDNQLFINDFNEDKGLPLFKGKKKKRIQLPYLIYVMIFTLILLIIALIVYIHVISTYKENYKYEDDDIYLKPSISHHNYSRLIFDNGLEVVLTQVDLEDKAGGAISFEKGYLNQEYNPGYLKLAFYSLRNSDRESSRYLSYYMGDLKQSCEEFYSTIYYTILNSGFQKYLNSFKEYISFDSENDNITNLTSVGFRRMDDYSSLLYNVDEREKHLIEFLVYNITDKNGNDIWRQGIKEELRFKLNDITSNIKEILVDLFNPKKIKLMFYSHYKMSLMKKMILRNIKNLTNLENKNTNEDDIKICSNLNTNKIIYHQIYKNESNYIKINYYINSDNNPNLTQLYIDSGYFNYLKYIIEETHKGSLYYKLTHPENENNLNIKSLSCNFEVVLKSKIKLSIIIKLNEYSYKHIKKIIEIVYNYMEKIKTHIKNIDVNDNRVSELYTITNQNFIFTEDTHTGIYYKNKAKDLFYKDAHDYFLKEVWVPPGLNKDPKKIIFYMEKLKLENSVIIIGINQYIIDKYNLNNSGNELSFIFSNLLKTTNYSNIFYSIHDISKLNLNIEQINPDYKFEKYENKFISKYDEKNLIEKGEINNNSIYEAVNDNDNFVKVYWLKNTNFRLPKVYINLYLFHPFMRPNISDVNNNDNLFFYSLLYSSYLQREINLSLSDAIRAGNTFKLGFSENFLYIDILTFSDVVEKILKILNEIIISKKEDIINENNFGIYRDYVLEDMMNFDRVDNREIMKLEYYKGLKRDIKEFPPVYNYYEFNKTNFINKKSPEDDFLKIINVPILYAYILGYYEKEEAENIYKIFSSTINRAIFKSALDTANYKNFEMTPDIFVHNILSRESLDKNIINKYSKDVLNNMVYSFMNFAEYTSKNRVAVELLKRVFQHTDNPRGRVMERIENVNQKNITLRFYFSKKDYSDTSQFKQHIIDRIKKNEEYYTKEKFDLTGDYYYYIVKNMENEYTQNPYNIKEAAISYSYDQLYELISPYSYEINKNNYKSFIETIETIFNKNEFYYEFRNDNSNDL